MFEELWIIQDGLCMYHKSWSETTLEVDGNLFSAFLTAFRSFQEQVFPAQAMRHIDFLSDRLVFLGTKYFFVVVRDQLEKPTERSIMQLTNIASELVNLVESEHEVELFDYFSKRTKRPMSLIEIEKKISPIIEGVITMLGMAEEQVNRFDIMTILQIMREIKTLISEFASDKIFDQLKINSQTSWFYLLIFSEEEIELDSVALISYKELHAIAKDFINQITQNLLLYGRDTKRDHDMKESHNKIISFLSVNSDALKRFGLIDKVLAGPVRFFKF
jgi:hypothetical protein